jgi:hypothetical protein
VRLVTSGSPRLGAGSNCHITNNVTFTRSPSLFVSALYQLHRLSFLLGWWGSSHLHWQRKSAGGNYPPSPLTLPACKKTCNLLHQQVTSIHGKGLTWMKVWPMLSSTSKMDAILPAAKRTKIRHISCWHTKNVYVVSKTLEVKNTSSYMVKTGIEKRQKNQ